MYLRWPVTSDTSVCERKHTISRGISVCVCADSCTSVSQSKHRISRGISVCVCDPWFQALLCANATQFLEAFRVCLRWFQALLCATANTQFLEANVCLRWPMITSVAQRKHTFLGRGVQFLDHFTQIRQLMWSQTIILMFMYISADPWFKHFCEGQMCVSSDPWFQAKSWVRRNTHLSLA